MSTTTNSWFVYMINATDNSLYTGITTDINRRWHEHRETNKGAKYFRGRKPKELLYVALEKDRSSATKEEMRIKKLNKSEKLTLIASKNNKLAIYGVSL